MRLSPIEKPRSLFMRLAFWYIRGQIGKVITPAKVVYARVPRSIFLMRQMALLPEKGFTLEPELRMLVQAHAAELNHCAFCIDIGRMFASKRRMALEKFDALGDFESNPLFTERERAALAYAGEATRNKIVSDETFARVRRQFNDREIVELTLTNAIENFYNLINLPLEIESDGLCALPAPARSRQPGHRAQQEH